ncbi:MAG TPA: CpaF family protein [Bacillota bacterium]|nr:CpaF family protein [Bacillota bacterium]
MGKMDLLAEIYQAQQASDQEVVMLRHRLQHPNHQAEVIVAEIKEYLANFHANLLGKSVLDTNVKEQVLQLIKDYIIKKLLHAPGMTLEELLDYARKEICGFGPLDPLIADDSVSEIMINNYSEIYVERKGKIEQTDCVFNSEEQLTNVVRKILAPIGRSIDLSEPYVDARLPGGSRVNAIISPLALNGTTVTIRKFSTVDFDQDRLIEFETCTREMTEFIGKIVRGKANILVIGGTGSGKTSTMKFCTSLIPEEERLVTIEDIEELRLRKNEKQNHVISLEARKSKNNPVTIYDLLVNSLRMRPDRIIIGEVRGKEALEMLEAMNTGHEGSMSTLHANGPGEAIKRLTLMIMRNGLEVDPGLIIDLICDTVDIIIHQKRFPEDGSRKIVQITEVLGSINGQPQLNDIFRFRPTGCQGNKVVGGFERISTISQKLAEKFNMFARE